MDQDQRPGDCQPDDPEGLSRPLVSASESDSLDDHSLVVSESEVRDREEELDRIWGFEVSSPLADDVRPGWSMGQVVPVGYELLEKIGHGGMGIVYKARQLDLDRIVALKTILGARLETPGSLRRFEVEARAGASLNHPNIVQVYEVGNVGGSPFLALEYVEGGDLGRRLARDRVMEHREAAAIVQVVARAAQAAHRAGIVHRDIKPPNILLTTAGEPKLADFGVAKFLTSDSGITQTQQIVGTPEYMAPEQVRRSQGEIGPPADVHALGAVLYHCLVGRPPFWGASTPETIQQVLQNDPIPPSKQVRSVPPDLETICLKCLRKEPGKRYADGGELADDLERFLDSRAIVARPVGWWEHRWLWAKREPGWASAAVGFVALLLVIVSGWIIYDLRLRETNNRLRISEQGAREHRIDALDAVRDSLVVTNKRLSQVPGSEPARRELLNVAEQVIGRIGRRVGDLDPETQLMLARVMHGAGELNASLGDTARALEKFRRAIETFEKTLTVRPDDWPLRRELSESFIHLAENSQSTEREPHFARAIGLLESALRDDRESRASLASAYYHYASVVHGDLMMSIDKFYFYINKSVKIYDELMAAEHSNDRYRASAARARHDLATKQYAHQEHEKAETNFRESLKVWRAIPESIRDDESRVFEAGCLANLGLLLIGPRRSIERDQEAIDCERQSLKIREPLAQRNPLIAVNRTNLASSHHNLAAILSAAGHSEAAIEECETAVKQWETILRDFPGRPDIASELAGSLMNLALWKSGSDPRFSEEAYRRALKHMEPLRSEQPECLPYAIRYADISSDLARLIRNQNHPAGAVEWHDRAVSAIEEARKKALDDVGLRNNRVNHYGARAVTVQALGRNREALADCLAVIDDARGLPSDVLTITALRSACELGESEQARKVFEKNPLQSESGGALFYNRACLASLVVGAIEKDPRIQTRPRLELCDHYTKSAVNDLEQARVTKYFKEPKDLVWLMCDPDLKSIHFKPTYVFLLFRVFLFSRDVSPTLSDRGVE